MSERTPEIIVNRALIRDTRHRLLVVRRSSSDSHDAGMLEFPGGKVDPDETVSEGLLREVQEETGLNIRPDSLFSHTHSELLTGLTSKKYPGYRYTVNFRSAMQAQPNQPVRLSEEHSEHLWLPSNELAKEPTLGLESARALGRYIQILRSL